MQLSIGLRRVLDYALLSGGGEVRGGLEGEAGLEVQGKVGVDG